MTSYPPAQCCTVGVKHEGTPTGSSVKIGDIEAYLAEPSSSNSHADTAILFLPDVIGIWQNSQLMADQFAGNGYLTIIPDLFNGDALQLNRPKDFDLYKWVAEGSDGKNPHTVEYIDRIVQRSIRFLKEEKGVKKLGSVGYCFGAKYTIRFLAPSKGIDVGYTAHPSFVDEEELRAIAGPLSISAAETDAIFPAEKRHQSEVILAEGKNPYQINLFSGVEHGFSVRCDTSVKHRKFAKEKAFLQAVEWFNEWLI